MYNGWRALIKEINQAAKSLTSETDPLVTDLPPSSFGMGGGGHGPSFNYPKWVWAPGGWWPQPKAWRMNTAVVALGIGLVSYPTYKYAQKNTTTLINMKEIDSRGTSK